MYEITIIKQAFGCTLIRKRWIVFFNYARLSERLHLIVCSVYVCESGYSHGKSKVFFQRFFTSSAETVNQSDSTSESTRNNAGSLASNFERQKVEKFKHLIKNIHLANVYLFKTLFRGLFYELTFQID